MPDAVRHGHGFVKTAAQHQIQPQAPPPPQRQYDLTSSVCRKLFYVAAATLAFAAMAKLLHFFFCGTLLLFAAPHLGSATPDNAAAADTGGLAEAVAAEQPDLAWYPPSRTDINNLNSVINGTGVYGFIFNSSVLPPGVKYGTYNWCNMPHVRREEYIRPSPEYKLEYVEVIHRHHKRTPYAANCFPVETTHWSCANTALYYYGAPYPSGNASAAAYWSALDSSVNPLKAPGFPGDCQFPQITHGGLDDSWQHGRDLYSVYHDLLQLIPDGNAVNEGSATFRVTNNVITSEVAGMVANGMFGVKAPTPFPLLIESDAIDSLEPAYTCNYATALQAQYGTGSTNSNWTEHLTASRPLYQTLNRISGVDPTSPGWNMSWDHYFDNLSARLCHAFPLPCNESTVLAAGAQRCITMAEAEEVFRLGEYEYSYNFRDAPESLDLSTASFGIWVAELAAHLRTAVSPHPGKIVYRHNVAHDDSLSRLLGILQIDKMVWPGMGSETVFELYRKGKTGGYFVRVLWGGQVMHSSNPYLGVLDMIALPKLLAYFDGLTGVNASRIPSLCNSTP